MGLRDKIPNWLQQFAAQCSSIPCLNYLSSSSVNLFEKSFWCISIITMFTLSSILVHQNFVQWQTTPTSIAADPTYYSVQTVQFPTVTICPDYNPDRFGFVRNLFNAFKFQCDTAAECQFPGGIRDFIPLKNITINRYLTDAVAEDMLEKFKEKIGQHYVAYAQANGDPEGMDLTAYMNNAVDWVEWSGFDISFYVNIETYLSSTAFNDSQLMSAIMDKLTGKANNYAIYDLLSYNKSLSASGKILTWLMYNYTLLTAAALAMPMPGGYGSVFTNFAFWRNTSDWNSPYIHVDWPDFNDNGDWWTTVDPNQLTDFTPTCKFFEDIVSTLVGVEDFGMAIYDIAPLLNPIISYKVNRPPYQYQFAHTFWNWLKASNATEVDLVHELISVYPTLPNNTFGKKLGPYLEIVMEIMYHNMLRTKALTRQRFFDYPEIYDKLMQFPVYSDSEPFYPSWDEYRGVNGTVPYMVPQTIAFYMGDVSPEYRTTYKGPNLLNDQTEMLNMRNRYQQQNFMTLCQGPGANNLCDDQFYPVLSDSGICYAFNAMNHSSVFINNTYTQMFSHIFQPNNNNATDILNSGGSGNSFKMFLILDNFKSKVPGSKQGTFKLSLNQKYDFVAVMDQEIGVEAGMHTKISVTVNQYVTTPAFQSLNLDTRQCRYANENPNPDSLFKFYSQNTCIFECKLQYSSKVSNCTPWNYPQYGSGLITDICDGMNSYYFEKAMDDSTDGMNCSCLPDCEEVKFTIKENKLVIDYVSECLEAANMNDINLNEIVGQKMRHMEGEEYLFWYNVTQGSMDLAPNDIFNQNVFMKMKPYMVVNKCQELLKGDLAFLTIEIEDPQVARLQRDVSTTFINKLSDLGGTIGLFTGISLLSIIEVGFWLYRLGFTTRI